MQKLYERVFYSPEVNKLFTGNAIIGYMLRFEAALAAAQARHGVIPGVAAPVIESCCKVVNIDPEQLGLEAELGGNINIPLVKQLTAAVRQIDPEAAKWVHFGATSQDVIDTAFMMQLQEAVARMDEELNSLLEQLAAMAKTHRSTVMTGRSFMQQARPVTFGYKVAGWLDALLRSKCAIAGLRQGAFVVQFGGAAGTLAGMDAAGMEVSKTLSELLHLSHPAKPWHTQRDRFASIAATLGILAGNIGKMAKDVLLLSQTEIAEVTESAEKGKGGSSTMPHKRNPVSCIAILANTTRIPPLVGTMLACMVQDHERGSGGWHAEWETLAGIVQLTAGCVSKAVHLTGGLEVHSGQMLRNLETTHGLIYAENVSLALATEMGKAAAHELLEQCCRVSQDKQTHLKEVVSAHPEITKHLDAQKLEALFDPGNALGLSTGFVDRVLDLHREYAGRST